MDNTSFRIGTLNVHGWSSAGESRTGNVPLLVTLLRLYKLDVLSLNEVCHYSNKPKDSLISFAKGLRLENIAFGKCNYFIGYGNAIVSAYDLICFG
jgi:hypothetical protein